MKVTVSAKGFLQYQIRMMVGAMVQASLGTISLQQIQQLLAPTDSVGLLGADLSLERLRAPANGLTLLSVKFKPEWVSAVLIASPYSKRGAVPDSSSESDGADD